MAVTVIAVGRIFEMVQYREPDLKHKPALSFRCPGIEWGLRALLQCFDIFKGS